jgi:ribosomal protein S18 acetylase RimI-like enzyme
LYLVATSPIDLPDLAGLTWRPLGPDVLDIWHALHEALNEADGGHEHLGIDDLSDELEPDWIDLARDSRIGLDKDGVARAFGLVQVRPGDITLLRASCWGGVHPQWRDRGVGRALLAWQADRAATIVADRREQLGTRAPAGALMIIEERAQSAARLAERAGFTLSRYFFVMRRDLSQPIEVPVAPAGLRLIAFDKALAADPGVDDRLRLAHNEAFEHHWGFQPWSADTWQQWETGQRDFRGDWSFLALTEDDEIAGYALSAGFRTEWEIVGYRQGWTSKLGVRAPWRGIGLAKALLSASMQAFAEDGMQYAGLDVDSDNPTGAVGLYNALGYEVRHRAAHWTKDL